MSTPPVNRAILLAGTLAACAMVVAAVSWSTPPPDVGEPVVVTPAPPSAPAAPTSEVAPKTRQVSADRSSQIAPSVVESVEEDRRLARVERVRAEIAQVFESRRPTLVARCFPEGSAGAPIGGITVQLTVDAEGREIARGVHDSRALSPEISACLREAMAGAVMIDPPGEKTDVEVFVSFP